MNATHVAILLGLSDVVVVISLCVYGDFISAVGMAAMGVICIGGGLLGKVQYDRTTGTSA